MEIPERERYIHDLVGDLSMKVSDLIHNELRDKVETLAEGVHVAAAVSARIASSALIGNIAIDGLTDETVDQFVKTYAELVHANCKTIQAVRLLEEGGSQSPQTNTTNPWD